MKSNQYRFLLIVLVLALLGVGQAVMAQDATATVEAPFDIQPVLVDYLHNLPDSFNGVKAEVALKELSGDVKPYLLDIRDEKDIAENGYIAGAVSIPIRILTQNLDKLPAQDQPIIVYCVSGHRGAVAMVALNLLGYTNVRSILGGINGWKAAGLPVETGMPAAAVASDAAAPEFDPALFEIVDQFITTLPDSFYAMAPTAALKALSADPKPVLIDVRAEQELIDNGYIDGQVNIPLRTLLDNPDLLPADMAQSTIVYCGIGHRGAIAMVALRLYGYTDVSSIGGGFANWVKNGLPIVPAVKD